MIARLAGRLARKAPDALIVDVHGVGYRVMVSLNTFYALPPEGDPVALEIHTHLRETALELFGFLDGTEKELFGALLTVAGVGPRVAINILSGIPSDELIAALAAGNVARLVAVPGVGRKTAERLVVELQDRARKLGTRAHADAAAPSPLEGEALSALLNLGYRQAEAERAVREALRQGADDTAAVIRGALKRLSK
jgi:Holliday junction DNA helicase RuvA